MSCLLRCPDPALHFESSALTGEKRGSTTRTSSLKIMIPPGGATVVNPHGTNRLTPVCFAASASCVCISCPSAGTALMTVWMSEERHQRLDAVNDGTPRRNVPRIQLHRLQLSIILQSNYMYQSAQNYRHHGRLQPGIYPNGRPRIRTRSHCFAQPRGMCRGMRGKAGPSNMVGLGDEIGVSAWLSIRISIRRLLLYTYLGDYFACLQHASTDILRIKILQLPDSRSFDTSFRFVTL